MLINRKILHALELEAGLANFAVKPIVPRLPQERFPDEVKHFDLNGAATVAAQP